MARVTSVVVLLLALVFAAIAFEHVDMSHDFLEVDPLQNEYAQLAEQGIAFTELGAEVEVEAEAEVEAEVDAEAEVEVDAEAEAEVEVDADAELEVENEPAAPVVVAIPGVPITDVPTPPAVLALPKDSYRIVTAAQAADIAKAEALQKKNEESARAAIGKAAPALNPTGWTFRERGVPESVNVTDVYALAYDRLKTKLWSTVNITAHYPIKEYTYVLLPGSGKKSDMKNVRETLTKWYGVPESSVLSPVLDYSKSAVFNGKSLFGLVNNTYWNVLKEQKFIFITNSNGVLPLHSMLAQYGDVVAPQIQGVITLNPIWGGSHIATDYASLAKPQRDFATAIFGFDATTVQELTYASRQDAVRTGPIDYNGLRVLTVATHNERSKSPKVQSLVKYVAGRAKEINDGFVAISDQIIPGGRAIILDGLTHGALAKTSKPNAAVDTQLAIQSVIYTFFKVTP